MKKNSIAIIALFVVICSVFNPVKTAANPFMSTEEGNAPAPPAVYTTTSSDKIIKIQFEFREKIADELAALQKGDNRNGVSLFLLFCFLYGIFHAAGPGHRKTIVFSLFLSRRVKSYEPALAGLLSAGLHGGSSIVIIGILYLIQKAAVPADATDNIYAYTEGFTFIFLILFSTGYIIYKIYAMCRDKNSTQTDTRFKSVYPLIIVSSIVPCPGATMLLILALYTGMIGTGIAGIVFMSLGMALVISFAGYLAYAGREGIFLMFKKKESHLKIVSSVLEIFSFAFIILFSSIMAWPFLKSVLF